MVTVVVDGVVTSSYRYTTLEDVTQAHRQLLDKQAVAA